METGDRVDTEYGPGMIAGFEVFLLDGKAVIKYEADDYERIAVKLDDGHTWCFKNHLCCFYDDEITLCQ